MGESYRRLMELAGTIAIVTGAGNGIGAALARRFAGEGARRVVVADIDGDAARVVADEIDGLAMAVDVTDRAQVFELVERVESTAGPIDLFASNAGVGGTGGVEVDVAEWQRTWEVNVMAHVHAAAAVLPHMLERGSGYLLQTASAAGLLTNIGAAPYSVTKHGAVALAEWLAVTYGDRGIRVSCLCPQFVRTDLLEDLVEADETREWVEAAVIEPDAAAEATVEGLRDERFLILPHPEVAGYFEGKARDYDRWLAGMRRLQAAVLPEPPGFSAL